MKRTKAMGRLLEIMSMLRDKEYGCPWDLEQTRQSLARHTLEEAYEVVDAIEHGTPGQLEDELGDLLFQVVFHAQIGAEKGEFDFADVAEAISQKLLRRHPHVFRGGSMEGFGQNQGLDASQVVSNWEAIKRQEREAGNSSAQDSGPPSVLTGVPTALPAIDRAIKLQKRAATVGFDWPDAAAVLPKVREELAELEQAMSAGSPEQMEHEVGDLLFAVVNLARHLGVTPESALRACNKRFENRFRFMEESLRARDLYIDDVGQEVLERYWEMAKSKGL